MQYFVIMINNVTLCVWSAALLLTETKQNTIMKDESLGKLEELQTLARKHGFVCMLFHIDDVQDRYDVTDDEALEVMEEAIWYMEGNDMIHSYIDDYFEANEIKEREEL